MPTVTLAAFGGAFACYSLGPWGVLAAGGLLVGWVLVALGFAERQQRRDIASGRIFHTPPRKPSRFARALQLLVIAAAGLCLAYGAWLHRQGADQAATQDWTDRALLLGALAGVFALVTDVIELALNRLRTGRSKTS